MGAELVPAAASSLAPAVVSPAHALLDVRVIEAGIQWAKHLAQASLLPEPLRGKPADVLVIVLKGAELGLSPLQALDVIDVVKGRPAMRAIGLIAMVKGKPVCKYFRLVEATPERATWETHRVGEPSPTSMSYTIDQAKGADLLKNDVYRKYPERMLQWKAGAALAKAVYPDITTGIAVREEIEDDDTIEAIVAPPLPARSTPRPPALPPPSPGPQPAPAAGASPSDWGADAKGPLPMSHVLDMLAQCTSMGDLEKMVPEIKRLSPEEQKELRPLYAKQREVVARLGAQEAAAAAPPRDRIPGEDDE